MFGPQIRLFELFGFEIKIDLSWLVLALLITWTLATGYFPMTFEGGTPVTYWKMGLACLPPSFFTSCAIPLSPVATACAFAALHFSFLAALPNCRTSHPVQKPNFGWPLPGPLPAMSWRAFCS